MVAGGFESITVAGPRGNLTRFPILPDYRGTRSIKMIYKEQVEKKHVSTALPAQSNPPVRNNPTVRYCHRFATPHLFAGWQASTIRAFFEGTPHPSFP